MKRLSLAALLAAAAVAAARDGFLGSGNHHDTTSVDP
jgi:hypothetical protein